MEETVIHGADGKVFCTVTNYEIGDRVTFKHDGLYHNGTISNKTVFNCYILGDDKKSYTVDWRDINKESPQSVYY